MSYRPPSRNVKRGQPQRPRGASRPIDPRYAPGGPPRRGVDGFIIGLVAVSVVAVFLVVLVLALQPKTTNGTTTNVNPNATSAVQDPSANVTATAISFATLTAPSVLPRISVQEAKTLVDKNDALIIDVREPQFYTTSHIKGAISIPQATVHDKLASIPSTGNVIVYCDCPHDEESAGVSYSLRSVGRTNVKILEGPRALQLWVGAGYPVEP
ncbi:MAG: rhodanese-like domain-containing protein [Chloroflexia bacterium]